MNRRIYILLFLLLPFFVACSARNGQLKPLRPGEEGELLIVAQPQLVTFSQLQDDPDSFRDRLIRVSGSLLKAPLPDCVPYSGPAIEWALISEELRLDATGFERAISMLDNGLSMTVDGMFRLYEGPLGCGKAAPDGSAWFLEVIKIVQPNPLVASGIPSGGLPAGATTPGMPVVPPGSTATATGQVTPPGTPGPGGTPTMTPTGLASAIPTATSTPGPGTITATSIPTASPSPSATSRFTPTPTRTPLPGTPTVTPTPTSTLGPGSTPTPTPTVDQYPGPGTPTATPTSDGYPPLPPTTLTPGYP
ncbi:MAG: hypothetical protein PVH18_03210 [Chloroflexota bacterium]